LGTQDLLIVDTADALLVVHRGHTESVKEVVRQSAAYPGIKFVFLFGSAPVTSLLIGVTSIMRKK
jgi:hypothetical protein